MASTSIAAELLEKINEIGGKTTDMDYRKTVAPLSVDDKLPDHVLNHLKRTMKGRYTFNMDRFCNRRGTVKPDGMFELFSRYTSESTKDIRQRMIDYVHANMGDLKSMTIEYFKIKHGDLMMWAYRMCKQTTPGDELALFILCKIYYRHAVIHTIKDPWCTVITGEKGVSPEVENNCDIVLVYATFGFYEAQCVNPVQTETAQPSHAVATASPGKTSKSVKKSTKRTTVSITDLLEKVQTDRTISKKVSGRVDTANVLPEGHKNYNTRINTPLRRRQSLKPQRDNLKNKNYSDSLDEFHLEGPIKRRRKQSVPSKLRSPSRLRVAAQEIITTERDVKLAVKQEDKKPKVKDEEEEEELRKIEARNRRIGANKKWPTDARLVHIDGTECSEHCMQTSIYHKDPEEIASEKEKSVCIENNEKAQELRDATENKASSEAELDVATPPTNSANETNCDNMTDQEITSDLNETTTDQKLKVTTERKNPTKTSNTEPIVNPQSNESSEFPNNVPQKDMENQDTSDDNSIELQTVGKKYDISRSKNSTNATNQLLDDTLPDIVLNSTNEWDLPGLEDVAPSNNQTDLFLNQIHEATKDSVSMEDNLPLLEQTNYLEDMETLMALDDDLENSELVPIGGPPTVDIVKDLNEALGINNDLEIAMENTHFIETNSNKDVAPPRPRSVRTNNTRTLGSPRGSFQTKTHGIRRMTPEDKQEKLFRCDSEYCNFTAYSRRLISEHYQDKHGKVQCDICRGFFSNPHALKRHMYDHSENKQFQCADCEQKFYFNSELTAHRMIHRKNPAFKCMASGCSKRFYRNSDLNAHVPVHNGIIHKCEHPGCTYSNTDIRLLKGHKRCHSVEKNFNCKYSDCTESFKHTMSRLRHYRNVHGEL